jgi:hypothetical protein
MRRIGSGIAAVAVALSVAGCTSASSGIPDGGQGPTAGHPTSSKAVAPGVAAEVAGARSMLAKVRVGGRGAKTGYRRTQDFGEAWVDVDANGCRTRDDILSRDLQVTARRDACVVTTGVLRDPYTGRRIDFSKARADEVQVDHVFPLGLAWQLGAPQWSQGERVAFANDPEELLAVEGQANQDKGDSGPDSWLPPDHAYRCTYVIRFTRIAYTYDLRLTPAMRGAIERQLDACRSVVGDPAGLQPFPASLWPRAAAIAS